jgi:hypothetical protein
VTTLAQGNDYIGVTVRTSLDDLPTPGGHHRDGSELRERLRTRLPGQRSAVCLAASPHPGERWSRIVRHARDSGSDRRGADAAAARRPRALPSRPPGCVQRDDAGGPTAAPARDWNERISADCYRPNAVAGNLGAISWDIGPTLAGWLQTGDPIAYRGFVEGDGGANGMAQPFHHAIMPLASAADRRTEIRWGLRD